MSNAIWRGWRRGLMALLAGLALAAGGCDEPAPQTHGGSAAAAEDNIAVHFSPQTNCRRLIIQHIRLAQKEIQVQAYSFTSEPIAKALVDAHQRGVKVAVIMDSEKAEKSEGGYMTKRGVAVYVDPLHEKAHSKIILIDGQTIITGSFNFSEDSDEEVADNLIVITGKPKLSEAYGKNFASHLGHSKKFE